jgi:signal peptidase I
MLQTLQIGDHILVNKFIYGVKVPFARKTLIPVTQPKKEDIIVFIYPEDPGKDFIKRVIGVAGDEIRIKDKKVFVNGKHLTGDYEIHVDTNIYPGKFNARDNYGPVRVPEGNVFVMGDNRDNSHDSRFWGFVPLKSVKGKAFIIYWSWKSEDNKGALGWLMFWKWVRWERIGDLLR